MLVYDVIYEGYYGGASDAIEFAQGTVWCECETAEQDIKYKRYVDTVDGVDVYYDYGADYYFFVDAEGA